jgi:hypothetical protein
MSPGSPSLTSGEVRVKFPEHGTADIVRGFRPKRVEKIDRDSFVQGQFMALNGRAGGLFSFPMLRVKLPSLGLGIGGETFGVSH